MLTRASSLSRGYMHLLSVITCADGCLSTGEIRYRGNPTKPGTCPFIIDATLYHADIEAASALLSKQKVTRQDATSGSLPCEPQVATQSGPSILIKPVRLDEVHSPAAVILCSIQLTWAGISINRRVLWRYGSVSFETVHTWRRSRIFSPQRTVISLSHCA